MEDDLQKKWKTNQSTKINLIGCDTVVNSPSMFCCDQYGRQSQTNIEPNHIYKEMVGFQ